MYKLPLRSILLSTLVLSGCLLADRFDSRVLKYNEQASNIRSQVLMVNILRSAYREPVMFTDLSAVTGTASASGGLDVKLPFGGSSSGYMLNPMASLSGGPTFNVVAYNTKDFYNGMLNPIPLKVFELYLEQGRPLGLLADLFFREITFTAKDGTEKTISSRWDPNKPANFSNFQNVTSDLSYAGLKIETCNYGQGPMGGQETVAGLPAAGMRMKKQKRLPNRAKKPGKVPADSWVVIMENREFCFDPPDDIDYRKLMVLNGGIVEARLCKDSRLRVAPPFDNECADAH